MCVCMCVGRNYADHVKEMRTVLSEPVLLLKRSVHRVRSRGLTWLRRAYCQNLHHEGGVGRALGQAWSSLLRGRCRGLCGRLYPVPGTRLPEVCRKSARGRGPAALDPGQELHGLPPCQRLRAKEKIPDLHALRLWLKVNEMMTIYEH
ncbi:oxaloacetate tautomerase FAHD1, mitochondrial-like [Peromyscus maniculatus bairdii]|uniref:oxaloacetate tautomerase FAHD1, mitochondrial-like n=1 Tax=Peromyscus maniculatus bairdii TaxID=230844 RepID=UPI003FD41353